MPIGLRRFGRKVATDCFDSTTLTSSVRFIVGSTKQQQHNFRNDVVALGLYL